MYSSHGRQCMANSAVAAIKSLESDVREWSTSVLDEILHKGDQMYMNIGKESYLTIEDLPSSVVKVSKTLHGTLNGLTEIPFYSLEDAIRTLAMDSNMAAIFTMGNGQPCYSSAVFKNGGSYFFFDPHSRNESGMLSAGGLATLTSHKTVDDLSLFIKHLSASLSETGTVPFEMAIIRKAETEIQYSSGSDVSTDFYMSEGDVTCRLFLAGEKASITMENVSTPDISDVSDPIQESSEEDISSSDSILNEENIDNALSAMNDSASFVNSIFESEAYQTTFMDMIQEGHNAHYNHDQNLHQPDDDPGHDGDNEESDDENVPLSVLKTHLQMNAHQSVNHDSTSPTQSVPNVRMPPNSPQNNEASLYQSVSMQSTSIDSTANNQSVNNNSRSTHQVLNDISASYSQSANQSINSGRSIAHQSANNDSTGTSSSNINRGRKRKRDENEWKRNIAKRRRNQGKSYVTKGNKIRSGRKMKKGCGHSCRYKCHSKFSEEERERLFNEFWILGDINRQRNFLSKYATKTRKGKEGKRSAIVWSFPTIDSNQKVCKTFF